MFRKNRRPIAELTDQVVDITKRVMAEQGIEREVNIDDPLTEDGLGFDSMGRFELLHAIEQGLRVDIPESHWSLIPFKNLRDMIGFVSKR